MNAKELSQKFNPSADTIKLFQTAIKAEAMVKLIIEKYEPIYQQIFNSYEFIDQYDGTKITKRDDVCFDKDGEKVQKYFKECNQTLLSMGYENAKKGWCPILEAEDLMREVNRTFAESVFNELMEIGIMKGIDFEQILFSYNEYKKFLELSKQIMFAKGITVTA